MLNTVKKIKKSIVVDNCINNKRNYYTAYKYPRNKAGEVINDVRNDENVENNPLMDTKHLMHPNFLYIDKNKLIWSFSLTHSPKMVNGKDVKQITESDYMTEPIQHTIEEADVLLSEKNEKNNVIAEQDKLEKYLGEEAANKLYNDLEFASDQKVSFEEMRVMLNEIHKY